MSKYPKLDWKRLDEISTSPESWDTVIVKSLILSQYVFDKTTETSGEKLLARLTVRFRTKELSQPELLIPDQK